MLRQPVPRERGGVVEAMPVLGSRGVVADITAVGSGVWGGGDREGLPPLEVAVCPQYHQIHTLPYFQLKFCKAIPTR